MPSFSWLYTGLGVILGFLFLGIIAELYYLLWRNNQRINTTDVDDHHYNKRHPINPSTHEITTNPPEIRHGFDLELGSGEDLLLKTGEEDEEETEDLELQGIYNLAGQPRFLFTIKEETKEDLESEDGKSRKGSRTRSLSDIIAAIETPFFTPMASPPLKASVDYSSYKLHGFNPLFESSSSLELEQNLNRLRSSPPPKFKFLRDAEEKLYGRLMEEARRRAEVKEKDGFVMNAKNEQKKLPMNQRFHYSSGSSQVLPLVSSPP